MVERGYFSFRYSIPGYTLIMLAIGVNIFPLFDLIRVSGAPEILGAVLGLVTLLTGSALGFLVSQFWWCWFHLRGGLLKLGSFGKEEDLLEEYGCKLPKEEKERKPIVEAILDLILFLEKEKKLLELVWRRWDMYHTLSSTYLTIWIGVIAGIGIRIYAGLFLCKSFNVFQFFNEPTAEGVYLIFFMIVVGILLGVFMKVRKDLLEKYYPLHQALVKRGLTDNKESLRKAFPREFPIKKVKKPK